MESWINRVTRVATAALCLGACLFLAGCGGGASVDPADLEPGGIYSVRRPDDTYGIVRLLRLDEDTAHLRLYVNRYYERPQAIRPEDLKMQGGAGGVEMGLEHMPMPLKGFRKWQPRLLLVTEVSDQELSGIR